VNFAAITLCVASHRVFIVVAISLSIQSGNFWIHPRIFPTKITWEFQSGNYIPCLVLRYVRNTFNKK
jgi:hypothetical protein